MKPLCLYFYMVLLMFLIKWNLDIWSKFTFNLAVKGLNHIHVRMCSKGKMKGAQCSEPVKSKVPRIWFVLKSKHFTVAQQQKLGTRGHQALLEHRSAHVCIPVVFLLKRWNKIKIDVIWLWHLFIIKLGVHIIEERPVYYVYLWGLHNCL